MDFSYTHVFWLYVGLMSLTSIYSSAVSKPTPIPKSVMIAYNLINSGVNLYIVVGMSPYVCNSHLGLRTSDDERLRHLVYLHYLTKYVDFFDTFTMIMRHKWSQVHILQLFHHSTIGIVWKWVYEDSPVDVPATYAFGAFANSFIHFLMYLHYFVTTVGLKNPLKQYMTAMQMTQFVLVLAHALWAWWQHPPFAVCSVVQVGYMCSMLSLFYIYVYRAAAAPKEKAGAPSQEAAPKSLLVQIRGAKYDVTQFSSVHPGGNIIEKYDVNTVRDATDAFDNFHSGSTRAYRLLRTLPRTSGGAGDAKYAPSEFQTLIAAWRERGLYSGGQLEFVAWASGVATLVYGGFYLLHLKQVVLGGLLVGFAWGQCGFVQHHAGHLAFTGNPRIDYCVQAIFEGLLKGGSGRWWRNRHNKHHAMPNSIEHDGDLRTTPFFAWDDVLIKKVPTALLRVQHLLFIPMLGLYVPILATSVLGFVIRRKYWDELGLIVLHCLGASRFSSNAYDLLRFYFIGYSVQGIYLGCMFGMSHYTQPRVETTDNKDWAAWQLETTWNWGAGSRFAEYISGFLNLQIEHHVATRMPPENYHLICDDLREYARRRDLPYREVSFYEAFTDMIGGLRRTGSAEYRRRMGKKNA